MDLSRWYNHFIDIHIKQTPSLYYNKFKHKLVYNVEFRVRYDRTYDFSRIAGPANVEQRIARAKEFADLYENRNSDCRMRLENYSLSIFHNDIDYLYNLATERLGAYKSSLTELYTNLNSNNQQAIEIGKCIMKTDNGYQYRANVRAGVYSSRQDNIALANYLVGLGDEVRVTKNFLHELRHYKYIQSRYFYLKDPAVTSMIMLIQPKLIKSVQEIVVQ